MATVAMSANVLTTADQAAVVDFCVNQILAPDELLGGSGSLTDKVAALLPWSLTTIAAALRPRYGDLFGYATATATSGQEVACSPELLQLVCVHVEREIFIHGTTQLRLAERHPMIDLLTEKLQERMTALERGAARVDIADIPEPVFASNPRHLYMHRREARRAGTYAIEDIL